MKNRHMHHEELRRRNDASFREVDRARRTTEEQLVILEKREGKSEKEITRLRSSIQYVVPE